jgi:uncharacterized membrane protein YcaP (DUF421 family)
LIHRMFHMELPLLEKILRPMIVYLVLIVFLRLFGKRELAQLNPFDLVVLLSLSNTVQNAMIGEDNSLLGGIVGAFSLLAINWLLMRFLFHMPKLNRALQGRATTLIRNGRIEMHALEKETLTLAELLDVIHKQNFKSFDDVKTCVLEPNGNFYIEGKEPSGEEAEFAELTAAMQKLSAEVHDLRKELKLRNATS